MPAARQIFNSTELPSEEILRFPVIPALIFLQEAPHNLSLQLCTFANHLSFQELPAGMSDISFYLPSFFLLLLDIYLL